MVKNSDVDVNKSKFVLLMVMVGTLVGGFISIYEDLSSELSIFLGAGIGFCIGYTGVKSANKTMFDVLESIGGIFLFLCLAGVGVGSIWLLLH
ncbi:hypothetical protein [Maridesulfovibrio sp.]|uniref:hypothetical protein n=1 Tax=Maridesulfovibrio sp. TaxID=2795000 RepID=UPI0039EE389B